MKRIIKSKRVSLQVKYDAIKPIVKWAFFDRKKPFKQLKNISKTNKGRIYRIYKRVKNETGFPFKHYGLKNETQRRSAIEKFNPHLTKVTWLARPILPADSNQNTEIRFKGKNPFLYNKIAKALIDTYIFGQKEKTGDLSNALKWVRAQALKKGLRRGQIITANAGDIYPSKNIAGESYDPSDIEAFAGRVQYLFDSYPDKAGIFIDSLRVVQFKTSMTNTKNKSKGKKNVKNNPRKSTKTRKFSKKKRK